MEGPLVHPYQWLSADLVPPAPFLGCDPGDTVDGSGVLVEPRAKDKQFRKAWLPFFVGGIKVMLTWMPLEWLLRSLQLCWTRLGFLLCLGTCSMRLFKGRSLQLVVWMVRAGENLKLCLYDVVKSFDTVDRGILDYVLSRLGLPGWFRHAYFEYHAGVRLRFKLACGLGEAWTRDGGIPQGCPLRMIFIVALYLSLVKAPESFR